MVACDSVDWGSNRDDKGHFWVHCELSVLQMWLRYGQYYSLRGGQIEANSLIFCRGRKRGLILFPLTKDWKVFHQCSGLGISEGCRVLKKEMWKRKYGKMQMYALILPCAGNPVMLRFSSSKTLVRNSKFTNPPLNGISWFHWHPFYHKVVHSSN